MKRWWLAAKRELEKVLKQDSTPHTIGLGFGIGTFIALFPTPGLNLLLGLAAVLVFPSLNRVAVFGAIFLWNPVVSIPIYTVSYSIGDLLFGNQPTVTYDVPLITKVLHITRRFLVGITIMATFLSLLSYFLVRVVVTHLRSRKLSPEVPSPGG